MATQDAELGTLGYRLSARDVPVGLPCEYKQVTSILFVVQHIRVAVRRNVVTGARLRRVCGHTERCVKDRVPLEKDAICKAEEDALLAE